MGKGIRLILFCLFSLFLIPSSFARNDSIYQGTQIKLDIASPAITAGVSKGALQHYEIAANVRLAKRFYPTLELGYAGGKTVKGDSLAYNGRGAFFRVGCDINPLKKNPGSPHALLIGVRLGTAAQHFAQEAVRNEANAINNGITSTADYKVHRSGSQADCWGEIIAGCQVEIAQVQKTAFYMGWMGRFKCLFTRQQEGCPAGDMKAIYIPGFGYRDNIGWGVNYYLGWRF